MSWQRREEKVDRGGEMRGNKRPKFRLTKAQYADGDTEERQGGGEGRERKKSVTRKVEKGKDRGRAKKIMLR